MGENWVKGVGGDFNLKLHLQQAILFLLEIVFKISKSTVLF